MNIERRYVPIELPKSNFVKYLKALKPKSILKTLKITMLFAIIVGMPLWAIYYSSSLWLLIVGAILLAVFLIHNILTSPPEDVDLITDPAYSGFSINIFHREKKD